MNLLLDSHTALWWLRDDPRLSEPAHDVLRDTANGAWISAVSFWELSIKTSIGKLTLPAGWAERLRNRMTKDAVDYLHILPAHCEAIQNLPCHHKDPFDRMLAAQAQCEPLTLVSRDVAFDHYEVARIW